VIAVPMGGDNAGQRGQLKAESGDDWDDVVREARQSGVDHKRSTVTAVVDEVTIASSSQADGCWNCTRRR
jgi:hypothetical protein